MAKKQRKSGSTISPAIGVIILGVLLLAAAIIVLLTQGSGSKVNIPPSEPTQNADIPYPNITRVSLADAKTAYDSGSAVFLDVRSTGDYNNAHVPGALSIPESEIENRLAELDPQAWIITYCT